MTIPEMRLKISQEYPGEKWHKKCKNMPDSQVVAIYNNIEKRKLKAAKKDEDNYNQMNLFDYITKQEYEKCIKREEQELERIRICREDDNNFIAMYNGKLVEFESESEYLRCMEEN